MWLCREHTTVGFIEGEEKNGSEQNNICTTARAMGLGLLELGLELGLGRGLS